LYTFCEFRRHSRVHFYGVDLARALEDFDGEITSSGADFEDDLWVLV
jgi:hypothetical protein